MLHNNRLSFIIVEYHSINEVLDCYHSILIKLSESFSNIEILVSSNSVYSEEEKLNLTKKYSFITWVFNPKNGGFAYAMNQGLKCAHGDILIIMNPDVLIGDGFENMCLHLIHNEHIGIIAPQIINKQAVVQDSFRNFITPFNFIKRHCLRFVHKDSFLIPTKPVDVDWVIGAFIMMTQESYKIVNGLDDHYFLYCEDMDLCKRMHLKGYSVVYYPLANIIYEGTRSARSSLKYSHIFIKSLCRYWSKFGFI